MPSIENFRIGQGSDRVTPKMMKELPRKGVELITYIFKAIPREKYLPKQLKTAKIILILRPGKDPEKVDSFRPISLLSAISKLLERFLVQRINTDVN